MARHCEAEHAYELLYTSLMRIPRAYERYVKYFGELPRPARIRYYESNNGPGPVSCRPARLAGKGKAMVEECVMPDGSVAYMWRVPYVPYRWWFTNGQVMEFSGGVVRRWRVDRGAARYLRVMVPRPDTWAERLLEEDSAVHDEESIRLALWWIYRYVHGIDAMSIELTSV